MNGDLAVILSESETYTGTNPIVILIKSGIRKYITGINQMNKVSHFHIPVDDMERVKIFYSSVFGWKIKESDEHYQMVTTTPIDKSGRPKELGGINGALYKRESSEDTLSIVIRVPSIDDYLKKIEEAGGKIKTKKTPAGDIGFHAEFYDTENNIIGLWEEIIR